MSTTRVVTVTRTIPAPAEAIFNLLASPREHSRFDGSGTVRDAKNAPERLSLGATFSMNMHDRLSYFSTNKVVAFEENRTIAWHHFAQFVWRYELEPVDGGTKVTESFDYSKPWGVLIIPVGFPKRNRISMERTLERIEQIVTANPAG